MMILTRREHCDFRETKKFGICVQTVNNDEAKLLIQLGAVDGDLFEERHHDVQRSADRVRGGVDIRTHGWQGVEHSNTKVVQTVHYSSANQVSH